MTMYMIMTFDFPDGSYIEIEGPNCRFWPVHKNTTIFEGSLNTFCVQFPQQCADMLAAGVIKQKP